VDQSGVSEREHLEQVERQTGRRPQRLQEPEFPLPVSNVWFAFLHLNSGRSSGMSLNPLSYLEIKSWMEITSTPLNAREVEALKKLDMLYLGVMNG